MKKLYEGINKDKIKVVIIAIIITIMIITIIITAILIIINDNKSSVCTRNSRWQLVRDIQPLGSKVKMHPNNKMKIRSQNIDCCMGKQEMLPPRESKYVLLNRQPLKKNTLMVNPETLKYWIGIQQGIVCLMGRKNSSALGGSLSRAGVSIKTLVGKNHKTQPQIE